MTLTKENNRLYDEEEFASTQLRPLSVSIPGLLEPLLAVLG